MTTAVAPALDASILDLSARALVDESRTYEVWPSLARLDGYDGQTVVCTPPPKTTLTEPEAQPMDNWTDAQRDLYRRWGIAIREWHQHSKAHPTRAVRLDLLASIDGTDADKAALTAAYDAEAQP